MWKAIANRQFLGHIVAVVVIAAATSVLLGFGVHVNPITVALAFLLIVLFVATAWGPKPAILASLLGVASFNFFFLPPVGTFRIAEPQNWIALFAFLVTAITAGQLSAHARRRAAEAESSKLESERLYQELQESFEQASQAQALKQSERLKSALLDAVTHDLRTPLTAIKASVTTLLADQVPPDNREAATRLGAAGRQEMLEVIDEEADRLNRFIEGLMELARIEAGELQLRKHDADLSEIIAAAIRRAEPRIRLHKIAIDIEDALPPVSVDEPALVEVIYVLLDNAAKYAPTGSLISVSAICGGNREVYLAVADQGPGIPAQLRERVFLKFFRASGYGSAADPPGTGMGLAIAQGIVEAHGGRIWNEDTPEGTGTRFVVALPMAGDRRRAAGDNSNDE